MAKNPTAGRTIADQLNEQGATAAHQPQPNTPPAGSVHINVGDYVQKGRSLTGVGQAFNFSTSAGVASDIVDQFNEALAPVNARASAITKQVCLFDRDASRFPLTMVLVYHIDDVYAYIHPIILESSVAGLSRIVEEVPVILQRQGAGINQQNYNTEQIYLEAGADQVVLSPTFAPTVLEFLKTLHPNLAHIVIAGVTSLPKYFDIKTHLPALMYFSTQAIDQIVALGNDDYLRFYTIKDLQNAPINVGISIEPGKLNHNPLGTPVRSDIAMHLTRNAPNEMNTLQVNNGNLGYVYGYMDMMYVSQVARQEVLNELRISQPQRDTRAMRYAPVFVTTLVDRPAEQGLPTEHLLFNMMAPYFLEESGRWVEGFYRPENQRDVVALQDFGAIGLEVNPMDPEGNALTKALDVTSINYTLEAHHQLCRQIFFDNLEVAIDIPASGPISWFQQMFNGEDVQKHLIQAAVNLFGTAFLQTFHPQPGKTHADSVIKEYGGDLGMFPHGDYINERGERRPSAEIFNYLGWLNFVEGKDDQMKRWSEARYQELRLKMMMEITQGTFELRGYHRRRIINPAFIAALVTCARAQHLVIQTNFMNLGNEPTQRGNAYFQLSGGMSVRGPAQQPQAGGPRGAFGGSVNLGW
jgi:hypothetical protein